MRLEQARPGTDVDELATTAFEPTLELERCDRCGAHAYVMATVPFATNQASALGLCDAHWRTHQAAITTVRGVTVAYSSLEALARS